LRFQVSDFHGVQNVPEGLASLGHFCFPAGAFDEAERGS
jgi:hypothetical protein